jgi:flagellar protein FlbD
VIEVTRLNDSKLVINVDLIEFVEAIPDTIISLTTGKKIIVKESTSEIIKRVAEFKRMIGIRTESPNTISNSLKGAHDAR